MTFLLREGAAPHDGPPGRRTLSGESTTPGRSNRETLPALLSAANLVCCEVARASEPLPSDSERSALKTTGHFMAFCFRAQIALGVQQCYVGLVCLHRLHAQMISSDSCVAHLGA